MPVCSDVYAKDPALNVPRNIITATAQKCLNKCMFMYNYSGSSSCVVKHEGSVVSILYDGGGDVTFNNVKYTPESLQLFAPSLHKYEGEQAMAELIVVHKSSSPTSDGLLLCIPIAVSAENTSAGTILKEIITNLPEQDTSVSLNIPDFTLNRIVPKAPFFNYVGPMSYGECRPTSLFQYVVFHPAHKGAVALSEDIIKKFRGTVNFTYIVATPGDDVFFNEKGTTINGFSGDGQIYIKCQATNTSDEEIVYRESEGTNAADVAWVVALTKYILGFAIIVVIYFALKMLMAFLNPSKPDFAALTEKTKQATESIRKVVATTRSTSGK
jgi:carbonic anhydrase